MTLASRETHRSARGVMQRDRPAREATASGAHGGDRASSRTVADCIDLLLGSARWRQERPAAGANTTVMAEETRLERQLDKWIARATTPRGAAVVIATVTTVITVVSGLLMRVLDHDNFSSLGAGLWWAIQTVTTVGYGDDVPESAGGQILAALVMLLGIGFLTVITAAITSTFVARSGRQPRAGSGDPSTEHLARIDERLERIEAALRERR
jgi:voltage-gated potassium channel